MGLDRENGVYCHAEHFGVCVGIAISHVLHFGQGDVAAVGIAEDENYSKKLSAINNASGLLDKGTPLVYIVRWNILVYLLEH